MAQKIEKIIGIKPVIYLDNITALTIMQEKEGADNILRRIKYYSETYDDVKPGKDFDKAITNFCKFLSFININLFISKIYLITF